MGEGHVLAGKDGGAESTGEGVAGTYRVCHFHLWRCEEGDGVGGEDVTAVDTARQHKHLQVVVRQYLAAFALNVQSGQGEETGEHHEFLVVYLQDVADLQRLLYHLLGVEVLTEVDVEYLQTVRRGILQELVDSSARYGAALCQ